jgi:hypothetical protein
MNWETLANNLVDYLCEAFSVEETIIILNGMGCSKQELICLQFDEYDIEQALENNESV